MAKSKILKTSDRHGTDRELYLEKFTTFLRDTGKKPIAELIDTLFEDSVGALAWDEEVHKFQNEFRSTVNSINELLKGAPVPVRGVSDELADQVREQLRALKYTYDDSLGHIAEMMLNSTAEFFISVQVVPLLKDLTAYLEERGGAA